MLYHLVTVILSFKSTKQKDLLMMVLQCQVRAKSNYAFFLFPLFELCVIRSKLHGSKELSNRKKLSINEWPTKFRWSKRT